MDVKSTNGIEVEFKNQGIDCNEEISFRSSSKTVSLKFLDIFVEKLRW